VSARSDSGKNVDAEVVELCSVTMIQSRNSTYTSQRAQFQRQGKQRPLAAAPCGNQSRRDKPRIQSHVEELHPSHLFSRPN
jgi:hypothetical protein